MVNIKVFEVENWMEARDAKAKYNIAETCSSSISLAELQALSVDPSASPISLDTAQTYGAIRGSEKLRTNVARLYPDSNLTFENVLITPGAIQANFLIMYALVGKGDHVICHYPTYQQLYAVPEQMGATVSLWKAKEENDWRLDVSELEQLITPNTKLIVLNNPNNPTGAYIPKSDLEKIVKIAAAKSIYILSDEVYRPLFHSLDKDDPDYPPSILSMGYMHVLATGSMSKAFALAGLRCGWILSPEPEVIENCLKARDYTTISGSVLSDSVAAYALAEGTVDNLLERNSQLARKNVRILDDFIKQNPGKVSWIRPKTGTTAFIRFYGKDGKPVEDDKFCDDLLAKTGVYIVPGKRCFGNNEDFQGYGRIGYVCQTEVLVQGLEQLKGYMEKEL